MDVFFIQIGGLKGSLTDINISVEYNPWQRFGFGAGINQNNLRLSVEQEEDSPLGFKGVMKSGFSGFMLYGRYFF